MFLGLILIFYQFFDLVTNKSKICVILLSYVDPDHIGDGIEAQLNDRKIREFY